MPQVPAIRLTVEFGTIARPYTLIAHWIGPDLISDLVIDFEFQGAEYIWSDGTPDDLFDGSHDL